MENSLLGCEFCQKADFGAFKAVVDGSYANIYMVCGSGRYPEYEQFNYCPVCGKSTRTTPTPAPLSLAQLKELGKEPVWVVWNLPRNCCAPPHWRILERVTDDSIFFMQGITRVSDLKSGQVSLYATKPAGEGEGFP